MIEFISFGSGSCGNCYYITNGRDALLLDAGIGIRKMKKSMRDYGIDARKIRAILVTHDHADHTCAAGYISSEYQIPVYSTQKVSDGIRRNFRTKRKVEERYCRIFDIETPFEVSSFRISPFPIPHDASENVGYFIQSDDDTFTLMTDVGAQTPVIKDYISRSRNLVIEANYDPAMLEMGRYPAYLKERIKSGTGHLSNHQTAQLLTENYHKDLQHIWLCHLSEENNHPDLVRKVIESAISSIGVTPGHDVNIDVLRRGAPCGPWKLGRKEQPVQLNLFEQIETTTLT